MLGGFGRARGIRQGGLEFGGGEVVVDAVGVEDEPVTGHEVDQVVPHVLQPAPVMRVGEQVAVGERSPVHRVVEVGELPRARPADPGGPSRPSGRAR